MKIVMVLYPGKGHKVEFGELEGQPVPGSAKREIGLRQWEGGDLEQNLQDADVLITAPF